MNTHRHRVFCLEKYPVEIAELSLQHRRYTHRRFNIRLSLLLSHTAQENHRFKEIKTTLIYSAQSKHRSPETTSTFKLKEFSCDMYCIQLKLITREGETLLAYLPSIAMMFCLGLHQSGRWRRGSGPPQGWRRGGFMGWYSPWDTDCLNQALLY